MLVYAVSDADFDEKTLENKESNSFWICSINTIMDGGWAHIYGNTLTMVIILWNLNFKWHVTGVMGWYQQAEYKVRSGKICGISPMHLNQNV